MTTWQTAYAYARFLVSQAKFLVVTNSNQIKSQSTIPPPPPDTGNLWGFTGSKMKDENTEHQNVKIRGNGELSSKEQPTTENSGISWKMQRRRREKLGISWSLPSLTGVVYKGRRVAPGVLMEEFGGEV
jgi:hypothetical protein